MPKAVYGVMELDCCYRCDHSYMDGPDGDGWYDLICDLRPLCFDSRDKICFDYVPIAETAAEYARRSLE